MSGTFHTTRWTLVRHATVSTAKGQAALSELCAAYYNPVVAFLRKSGRDEDSARESAHAFFADLLARPALGGAEPGHGRFRSYLLGALKHHLANARQHHARQRRGGGIEHVALDTECDAAASDLPPDREFDRQWALHVLDRAMQALRAEWTETRSAAEFDLLRPHLAREPEHGALACLADEQGWNPATLRKTLSRLRQRFRHHVKEQIKPTLDDHVTAEDEMAALLGALGPG